MIKQKKTSKFKNKFKNSFIIVTAITTGVIATFSAYFINPKPVFAQQEQQQEKTVVFDLKKYYNYNTVGIINNKYNDLTKEEKQMILKKREKIVFERAEKDYNEREWRSAMCEYSYLANFPKYKEYAIERAYECMDHAGYYSASILKKILIIVNKYTKVLCQSRQFLCFGYRFTLIVMINLFKVKNLYS